MLIYYIGNIKQVLTNNTTTKLNKPFRAVRKIDGEFIRSESTGIIAVVKPKSSRDIQKEIEMDSMQERKENLFEA